MRNWRVQTGAGGARPKRCDRYEERGSILAAKGGVTTASIGAAGRGATINAAGLWKRTRQSAQRPSSTLAAALVTYLCCEGSGWKWAMPTVCARSSIAAVIPAILCIQRRRSLNVGCIKSSGCSSPLPGTHQSVGFRRLGQVQPSSVHRFTRRLIGTIDNDISISISQQEAFLHVSIHRSAAEQCELKCCEYKTWVSGLFAVSKHGPWC